MDKRTFTVTALVAAAMIGGALLFLNSGSDPLAHSDGTSGDQGTGPGTTTSAVLVRKLRPDELVEPPKKTQNIEKVDPQKYTTAPPGGSQKSKIFKIAMELGTPEAEKVRHLLAMVPTLPHEEKSVALDHATQLIPDADYANQRPRLLKLADTDELREVVLLDLLTRDDTIKMPGLVELMRQPHAAMKTEAREVLEAYLEQDHGDDLKKWDTAVRQWLAENADI